MAAITIAYEIVQKMEAAGECNYPEKVEWDTPVPWSCGQPAQWEN